MLSKSQERLLHDLLTKKGRKERGMFIIEGRKFVNDAGRLVEFEFTPRDSNQFREYVSTVTPQSLAAVARVPGWTIEDMMKARTVVVLDHVQDPGNVGTILRACLGFRGALILVESAEVTNPKTVRASASAILHVPWIEMPRDEAEAWLKSCGRPVYRLEKRPGAVTPDAISNEPIVLIAGNEGSGISLEATGTSVVVPHDRALDSLNVAMATALVLSGRYNAASLTA